MATWHSVIVLLCFTHLIYSRQVNYYNSEQDNDINYRELIPLYDNDCSEYDCPIEREIFLNPPSDENVLILGYPTIMDAFLAVLSTLPETPQGSENEPCYEDNTVCYQAAKEVDVVPSTIPMTVPVTGTATVIRFFDCDWSNFYAENGITTVDPEIGVPTHECACALPGDGETESGTVTSFGISDDILSII